MPKKSIAATVFLLCLLFLSQGCSPVPDVLDPTTPPTETEPPPAATNTEIPPTLTPIPPTPTLIREVIDSENVQRLISSWDFSIPADSFRTRHQGCFYVEHDSTAAGQSHLFRVATDSTADVVSLSVSGIQILTDATGALEHQSDPSTTPVQLNTGWHSFVLDYLHETSDPAGVRLFFSPIALEAGMTAETVLPIERLGH